MILTDMAKANPCKGACAPLKARAKGRCALIRLAGQVIAPIPPVADPARLACAHGDFKVFCETYVPDAFRPAWSADPVRSTSFRVADLQPPGWRARNGCRGSSV